MTEMATREVLIADMEGLETKTVGAGKTHDTSAFLTIQVNTGVSGMRWPFSQGHEKLVQDQYFAMDITIQLTLSF
jgi:hypothetical protein